MEEPVELVDGVVLLAPVGEEGVGGRADESRERRVGSDELQRGRAQVESVLKMGIVDMLQRWTAKKVRGSLFY